MRGYWPTLSNAVMIQALRCLRLSFNMKQTAAVTSACQPMLHFDILPWLLYTCSGCQAAICSAFVHMVECNLHMQCYYAMLTQC